MSEDTELLREFLVECNEGLDQLDREFVQLESDPTQPDRIATIFRAIHTIKGTSGFLGFHRLESITHAGESLLAKLRDGHLTLTPEIATALLTMVDAIRKILATIDATGEEGAGEDSAIVGELIRLLRGTAAPAIRAERRNSLEVAEPPARSTAAKPAHEPTQIPKAGTSFVVVGGTPSVQAAITAAAAAVPSPIPQPAFKKPGASRRSQVTHDATPPAPRMLSKEAPKELAQDAAKEPPKEAPKEQPAKVVADTSIRVDVGLLDKLMNLVGELVLARNQILQSSAQAKDPAFLATTQRLNLITTELQEGIMKTRMQPIGSVWSKFPRVVRDLAQQCKKSVKLEMEGAETDLDRTIIEAIKDPLTHVVRNAIDHGVEDPDVRAANGKPRQGTLKLRAFHEGGQVNIEMSDDGGGIDPEKVRRKAIEKGLVAPERAARMSEREVIAMIFLPGFSTAAAVTNVSGRGVGMDVVKTNIEKIGGTVDVSSKLGHGTSLRIKIPLTLAIVPALIVRVSGERFAIPQVSLLELVRLESDVARAKIEEVHGVPVYRLRGNLLPLVFLNRALGLPERDPDADDPVNIVVLQAEDRQFGLVVDLVSDTEEIVVKPLGKELKSVDVFAGATIMGDGKVALILDVLGLAQRSNVIGEPRERALGDRAGSVAAANEARQSMLLFQVRPGGRAAIPLSVIARLEEFPAGTIERAGDLAVVQYRGELLPLIDLRDKPDQDAEKELQVVVYTEGDKSVGLVVDRILDIVEEQVSLKLGQTGPGLLGAAVIQERVTDVLDVRGIVLASVPRFLASATV